MFDCKAFIGYTAIILSMGRIGKTFALILSLIIVTSCLTFMTVRPTSAQAIPKPSVPEYNLRFEDKSFYASINYPPNPQDPVVLKDNRSIIISIKNQPFTSYMTDNGSAVDLYYNLRWKIEGHDYWTLIDNILANKGNYTILIFNSTQGFSMGGVEGLYDYDSRIDPIINHSFSIQLQAFIGINVFDPDYFFMWRLVNMEESGWSNIQTIIPTKATATPTPNTSDFNPSISSSLTPTPSPTVPECSWLVILPLLLSMFTVAVVLRHRKITNSS